MTRTNLHLLSLATFLLNLFTNFFWFVVTLLIRDFDFLVRAHLSRDVLAGVVGCDDLDLVAVGWGQRPLALRLTVEIKGPLANLKTK